MPLSWIKRPKSPASVDELVAAGKYEKAVVRLREQFSERYPSTEERQRYAGVLVLAGRGTEAVPVLLGIADEQERYGFPDRALEALRRAAEIDPEQAEVKERLSSIQNAPRRGSTDQASAPADPSRAADSWGAALDEASSPDATSEGTPKFVALDADEAESPGRAPSPGGEPPTETPGKAVDQAEPQPDGEELVVVGGEGGAIVGMGASTESEPTRTEDPGPATADGGETTTRSLPVNPAIPGAPEAADEGEITARSLRVDPGVLGARELEAADEREITARSLHVHPSVLGDPEPEEVVDEGEITARSLLVDPSVLGPAPSEAKAEDEGEITARSLLVDPSVFGEPVSGTAGQDPGEQTATSLRVDPSVGGGETSGPAAPVLLLPEDELEPEEDLDTEEVEELTAEDEPGVGFGVGEPEVRADAPTLPSGGTSHPQTPWCDVVDAPEADVEGEADASPGTTSPITDLTPLLTEEDLRVALTADAQALLAGRPTRDAPGSADDDDHLHELLTIDARALLSQSPTSDGPAALADGKLDELLTTDARALLADGPQPDQRSAVAASGDTRGGSSPADPSHETGGGAAPAADALEAPLGVLKAEAEGHEGEATGAEEASPAAHPDETHLFLSEEDLFGALTEGPTPPSNGNGNGSGARGEGARRPTDAAAALAARPAPPVEEEAESAGEEQGHQLAS